MPSPWRRVRPIGHLDLPGGGQVVVQGHRAFVGHMAAPEGTSIIDVADPRRPRVLGQVTVPAGIHSHKVRVVGDLMLVNNERTGGAGEAGRPVGLRIFNVADPTRPKELAFFRTAGTGVHRFDVDNRYAYLSAEVKGFLGNITLIVDLADPAAPREVSRWWLPGQWLAGGEVPTWAGRGHRTHHPLRCGDRLYVSCWHAGFVILDIADLARPRFVSGLDWSPPYPCPTHTALRIPFPIEGRQILVVTDEDVEDRLWESPAGFLWVVDITDETRPVPIATHRVPQETPPGYAGYHGAHQPCETVQDTMLYVAWFSKGLRILDIADPYRPREVGAFVPPRAGGRSPCTNDVCQDARGLLYVIDRQRGLDIVEFSRPSARAG